MFNLDYQAGVAYLIIVSCHLEGPLRRWHLNAVAGNTYKYNNSRIMLRLNASHKLSVRLPIILELPDIPALRFGTTLKNVASVLFPHGSYIAIPLLVTPMKYTPEYTRSGLDILNEERCHCRDVGNNPLS